MTTNATGQGPLAPYRVLDLADERGLLCGQLLADLGAYVVSVEPPEGNRARRLGPFAGDVPDPERSLTWWAWARNKRSLTLDLASDAGKATFRDLVRAADFLIESFAPGHLEALGLGWAALATLNPRLILVSITAFGQTGPKAGWAASDLTAFAASGTLWLTGDPDRAPVRISLPQAYLHASAEAAASALVALAARERDGLGQHVDAAAQTAAMLATMHQIVGAGWNAPPIRRVGGGIILHGLNIRLIYPCRDGYVNVALAFGTGFAHFTRRLMDWLYEEGAIDAATRDKDWMNYPALLAAGQEPESEVLRLQQTLERFTATRTKTELFQEGFRRGLLLTPVMTVADQLSSAQLQARGYWGLAVRAEAAAVGADGVTAAGDRSQQRPHSGDDRMASAGGTAVAASPATPATAIVPGPFARFARTPVTYRRPAPRLGEHTSEVLRDWAVASRADRAVRGDGQTVHAAVPHAGLPTHLPAFDGLKVLDFGWAGVGPWAIRFLTDHRATVIRVESQARVDVARALPPMKDGIVGPERSGCYASINPGKLGITLNLAKPEARAVALRLVRWADVVADNFSAKVMRTWGLTYEAFTAVNPSVIVLSTCLNGHTGPYADLAGYGTLGAMLAGFGALTGWPDRAPCGPYSAYTDFVSPRFVALALLAALDHRRRTGHGQYIDVSQVEATIHFLAPAVLDYTVNGRIAERRGNASPDHAPHGIYPCAGDDRWVAIACETAAQWRGLCRAVGDAALASDPRFASLTARLTNCTALEERLSAWTRLRDVAEV
jgi:crotonobetainyl-CoA:carnitine CoA-transferase CaiB-like acyl-CoA transferase